MIRVISCDLDGTLLDSRGHIRPASGRMLRNLSRAGYTVVLATGRSWRTAVAVQQALGIRGPIVAHNGAYLVDTARGQDLYRHTVPLARARAILAFADETGIMVRCYLGYNEPVLFNRFTADHLAHWLRPEDREVPDLAHTLSVEPLEIFFFGKSEVERFLARFGLVGQGYELSIFPHNDYREVNICAPGVDKVEALSALVRRLGLGADAVLALGDGLNDLRMLRWAGVSVAMPHAVDEVKRASSYVPPAEGRDPVEAGLRWALGARPAAFEEEA